jgi:N-acyl-D-aspartate/D-glutamate deacylase
MRSEMFKRCLIIFSVLIVVFFSFKGCSNQIQEKFDVLITNGQIADGSGDPLYGGDIGIRADTIVKIGDLSSSTADTIIDAQGLVVSPGFIDMHTHCDRGLGKPSSNVNLNYLTQGVTTVVTGNCGDSVSLNAAEEKSKWEEQGIGTNAVFLIGFGTIRKKVMGVEPREATDEEIAKMESITRLAMEDGAWGVSSGLDYIPDRYSRTEELVAVNKVVNEFGGVYSSHMRNENAKIVEAIKETIEISEESGVPANVAHFKLTGKKNWGLMKEAVKEINDARTRDVKIFADQYPYNQSAPIGPISSFLSIPGDIESIVEIRRKMRRPGLEDTERAELQAQYMEQMKKALGDKTKREQIKKLTVEGLPHDPSAVAMWGWHDNTVMVSDKYPQFVGKNFIDIFEELGGDPFDIVVDFVLNDPNMLYAGGAQSEEDVKHAMKQEWVMTSTDGGASPILRGDEVPRRGHPRAYGSFPRVFRKYVREENLLTLEDAVRKMTALPASFLSLGDRGLLVEGYRADVVVFNPETIGDNATYADSRQYSTGVEYVLVNGKISIENGEFNNTLSGKLLLLKKNN